MPTVELINLISSGGLVTALLTIIIAGAKKQWAFGYQLKEKDEALAASRAETAAMKAERDLWTERTLRALDALAISTETNKALVKKSGE